jgi:hypothetical protein
MNAPATFDPDKWRRVTQRRNPDMDVEDRIVATLVADLLAHNADWHIAVMDGEEIVTQPMRDAATIMAALFSTDEDYLQIHFTKPAPKESAHAWVRLIGGNGCDIVSDYTTNIPDVVFERSNAIAAEYH